MTYLKQWCLFLATLLLSFSAHARQPNVLVEHDTIAAAALPHEARQTLALIRQGPPFPFKKDGVVFGNHEGLLPKQPRGYYHEFTVKTPGTRNRGAQRLIVGGKPMSSNEIYYTSDHYSSFSRVRE